MRSKRNALRNVCWLWLFCAVLGAARAAPPEPQWTNELGAEPGQTSPPIISEFSGHNDYLARSHGAYVWAEGLVLKRDNDSANRPLVLDLNTDEVLLAVGDLDFIWSGGLRLGYGQRACDCWGVPGRLAGRLDGRQQQRDQNADDCDHHQQFHQGEAVATSLSQGPFIASSRGRQNSSIAPRVHSSHPFAPG
jgi:hypothetical protein